LARLKSEGKFNGMAERFFILWHALVRRVAGARATPAARERTLASAVFAGIFVFAAGSVDYLITGGPDWNPGGGELQSAQIAERAAPTSLQVASFEPPPSFPAMPAIEAPEFDGPVADLLGGPDPWAPADYEDESAPSAEFNETPSAGKQIEIAYPAEPSFAAGKNKPLTTIS
jgi:hypothetical protein